VAVRWQDTPVCTVCSSPAAVVVYHKSNGVVCFVRCVLGTLKPISSVAARSVSVASVGAW
jgi:hypothetical protein